MLNRRNKAKARRCLAALTLIEMLLVITLVAGLSAAIMLPAWKGWKRLELKHEQKQVHEFFETVNALMLMSQAEIALDIEQVEGKERIAARGCLLDPKVEKISITLEKGLHLEIKARPIESKAWVISTMGFKEELLLRLENASGYYVEWKETLCLLEKT